ncbi:ribonuclease P protein subunit p14-like [Dreissena polymorpha]|uniref:Uncharacterized protein n=1 Tax=Dreissena polymorpha TaxID=45954 RepID=A0A9D4RWI1_DREPO|nr:ribonuclease P protein subunit p14-like [Dreissena polymorpha]KAH3881443.1 hypothetical protein DPMN_005369 [Dreissena polymorpha]
MYKKVVSKGCLDFCYMKVRLDFEEGTHAHIDIVAFKQIILEAAQSMFGLALSCSLIDVLIYEKSSRTAVLRIPNINLSKIWSALSLYSNMNGLSCAFRILQISPHLMALSGNSRLMSLEVVEH